MTLDIHKIRADFPVLDQQVNGSSLIYFDNAATTQKPKSVIDALSHYYASDNANIHRGLHALAERATNAYELTRTKIKEFINIILMYKSGNNIYLCYHIKYLQELINSTMFENWLKNFDIDIDMKKKFYKYLYFYDEVFCLISFILSYRFFLKISRICFNWSIVKSSKAIVSTFV